MDRKGDAGEESYRLNSDVSRPHDCETGDVQDAPSWRNFMESTTFHGVRYIFESRKRIRRCLHSQLGVHVSILCQIDDNVRFFSSL